MAVFHGKAGKVVYDGVTLPAATNAVTSWTLETVGDVAEATAMGGTWKTRLAGFTTATATTECIMYDTTDYRDVAIYLGNTHTLALWINAANFFTADAIMTGASIVVDMNDVGKISFTWQIDSATPIAYG